MAELPLKELHFSPAQQHRRQHKVFCDELVSGRDGRAPRLSDENEKMQKELKQIWSRRETAGSSCPKRAKIAPVAPPLPVFCRSLSLSFEPECVRAFAPGASERASRLFLFVTIAPHKTSAKG